MTFTPQEPLRIAFIGGALNSAVGFMHFNASRLDGHFRVEAGCFSRDSSQNEHSARVYGVTPERVYRSWRELLGAEAGSIDAVVILTPTPNHTEIVIEAIDAGFPVICEKALAVSSTDCLAIEEAVERKRGYLAVTYNYSGYPMVRELQQMIREGRLGKIQQIQIEMPQEGFLRLGANPQDWRRVDHAVPTVSLDLGIHVHHLVDFLTGGCKPRRLVGDQSSYGQFGGLIDNVYCLAHYEDDIRVNAWWGKTALGLRNGLRIRAFGDSASAEWFQMEPENLNWADNDGRHCVLDRASGEAKTAQQLRYNRFKAGHPSGFIEAFANLYADIAGELRSFREGGNVRSEFVFGASQSREGLHFLEKISESARQMEWLNL
ncbi:MAG: Gfo/Idh/MocA family oxidoreductase [Betaproteobacteria bacterium]|nr:Gfo/Idh/MocA family oxidoreductase [Betaproteobacteria bacterium]